VLSALAVACAALWQLWPAEALRPRPDSVETFAAGTAAPDGWNEAPPLAMAPPERGPRELAIEEIRQQALGEGLEHQAEILADGVVTFEEYAGSVDEVMECGRRAGVRISEPELDWAGVRLEYWVATEGFEEEDQARVLHDGCYREHAMYVDIAFQTSQRVRNERRRVFGAIVDCLASQGVPSDLEDYDPKGLFQLRADHPDEFVRCRERNRSDPRQLGAAAHGRS
jgi:hypothetical protein